MGNADERVRGTGPVCAPHVYPALVVRWRGILRGTEVGGLRLNCKSK